MLVGFMRVLSNSVQIKPEAWQRENKENKMVLYLWLLKHAQKKYTIISSSVGSKLNLTLAPRLMYNTHHTKEPMDAKLSFENLYFCEQFQPFTCTCQSSIINSELVTKFPVVVSSDGKIWWL